MSLFSVFVVLLLGFQAARAAPPEIRVRDIGVVGLFSHDVFAWDHRRKINTENGRLDLSTIFDYAEGSLWESGGNPKNSDNPPVYTVTRELVEYYITQTHDGLDPVHARKNTVIYFHQMVRETYERLRQRPLPEKALRGFASDLEQAAFRGLHDVLPGRLRLIDRWMRDEIAMTSPWGKRLPLSKEEMDQIIPTFNGDYDIEFKEIQIPFTNVVLNLKEIDRKFIESHSDYKQSEMLSALKAYGRGELTADQVFFVHHVDALFAKALCPEDNEWMPQTRVCE